jgi:hypothetical protein
MLLGQLDHWLLRLVGSSSLAWPVTTELELLGCFTGFDRWTGTGQAWDIAVLFWFRYEFMVLSLVVHSLAGALTYREGNSTIIPVLSLTRCLAVHYILVKCLMGCRSLTL